MVLLRQIWVALVFAVLAVGPGPGPGLAQAQAQEPAPVPGAEAALAEARAAIRAQDYVGALAALQRPGLERSPEVLLMQASIYQAGRGVARDDARAYALTEAAAALGSVDAQYNLGRLLLSGRGVERDRAAGQAWIARAAEGGHIRAAALLVNLLQSPASPAAATETAPAAPVQISPEAVQGSDMSRRMGWTPLMEAARRGEPRVLEPLLSGADLEARDSQGRTALMLALEGGNDMAVDMLLRAGADIEAVDNSGTTPLGYAARSGEELQLRMLLSLGAWPDIPNEAGQTPLEIAVVSGHPELASLMLEKRGLTLSDALLTDLWLLAARHGAPALVAELAERGGHCGLVDAQGRSTLAIAAEAGNMPMVQHCLVAEGAAAADMAEALLQAVRAGHTRVAEALLAAGASPDAQTQSGNTPLLIAANGGNAPLVAALIAAGADVDHRNQSGNSALMLAARKGLGPVIDQLLAAGADTGLRNKLREQAYSIAAAAGYPELAARLE